MKKIILTTVLAITGMITLTTNAQTTASFGIKLEGNLNNTVVSGLQKGNSSFKPGVALGGFSKIEFGENFALQPELLFNYTERKEEADNEKIKFKYASVELPVYAIGQTDAGKGKVFFGAGPHIGYGFSVDSNTENLPQSDDIKDILELNYWYMGGGVIAGYEFNNGIILNAGYKLGYNLSSKKNLPGKDIHTISLGIGYRF